MANELEIKKQKLDDHLIVELYGNIDEDSNFETLTKLDVKIITFDFDGIKMINSCGVRDWIQFIEKIPADTKIIYKKCPQIVIEQINMVHGFIRKGAKIDSFYAPYYSEDKDEVIKVLLKSEDVKKAKAPEIKDQETGEVLEFDAIEAQYFNFLNQAEGQ